MSPARLLEHFERIAEAPGAIPRLRRFVLDLAVRGKLVEQDPNDEPAAELLGRIFSNRDKHTATKQRNKTLPEEIDCCTAPHMVPSSWAWENLQTLSDKIHYGYTASADKTINKVRLLRITDIQNNKVDWTSVPGCEIDNKIVDQYKLEKGDILIARTGGTVGKSYLIELIPVVAVFASYLIRVKISHLLFDKYIKCFFESPTYWVQLYDGARGAGQPNVNGQTLGNIMVPTPPLAEQHRIVAKVDELMALCDRLEASQTKRESRRDRLVAASLKRIGQPEEVGNGDEFRANVRFHLHHLPRLATRPEHIKELRQTILNLAVRGKLVAQDPSDEPAAELLKTIKAENEQPQTVGRTVRETSLGLIKTDETPFDLPSGWTWTRFPEVGIFGRGKSKHRPRNDSLLFEGGTHLFIQTGDVARSRGLISTFSGKYNDVGLAQSAKWPAGTLCITIAANIADSGILTFDACFPDSVVGFIPASIFESARYFEYFMRTIKSNLLEFAPATAQKNINLSILNSVLIPLPPLAEQNRIVAKVDELMALCDQIETHLKTSQFDRARLLEATLAEALGASEPPAQKATRSPGMTNAQPERIEPSPKIASNSPQKKTSTSIQGSLLELPPQTQPKPTPNAQKAILAHMQPNQDYTRAQLCEALGLSVYEWNMAIKALKERGKVVQRGEKRGARYRSKWGGKAVKC